MTKRYLAILVLIAVGLGGCGSTEPSEPTPNKQQFVQQATNICSATEGEELKRLATFRAAHPTADEEETLGPVAIPALETQIERLSALSAPEGDEAAVQDFINQLKEDLEEAKSDPERISPAVFAKSNRLAHQYGITACSHVP